MTGATDHALCSCGSGLRLDRCCGLDWAAFAEDTASCPQLDSARRAIAAGEHDAARIILAEVLNASPKHSGALALLHDLSVAEGRTAATRALLARIVRLDPNNLSATQALALLLFQRGAFAEAEPHARNAVRLAPTDAQSHNLMGMILTEAQRPQAGEFHYRRALELLTEPSAILLANLAWNLKTQGRMEESRRFYEQSAALDPNVFQTLLGWARMEETDRQFNRALELLESAESLMPADRSVLLERAVVFGRIREYGKAVALLDRMAELRDGAGLGPLELSEKGLLLDKMGRYDEAFASFSQAKRALRLLTGQSYRAGEASQMAHKLREFFQAHRLGILPRASVRADTAQPVFIAGFPRSGTTMVEQMLSAHPSISAGDELPIVHELTQLVPRMLNSPLAYPDALCELWFGDQAEGLDNLRDYYLQRARQLGALKPAAQWFTDKMPLNEMHLGLIRLMFPQAPVIHMVRHPLDVVLSAFSNHLTHGFYCAYDLETIAVHYVLVMELVEHYCREMPLRYLRVRYEDLIERGEEGVRAMLEFIGAPYDERCLNFHDNRRYARTASYAQVTEKLYVRSRYRYRSYRRHLAPVVPILEPVIRRLGYSPD